MNAPSDLVRLAARNNAEWVATMCDVHGIASKWGTRAWSASTRTPPYHPDAISLVAGVSPSEVVACTDRRSGASVKDSFADIDLSSEGFTVLFDAQWIHHPGLAVDERPSMSTWDVVRDLPSLKRWARAAGDMSNLFRAGLLRQPSVRLITVGIGDAVVGGAVVNDSTAVVGISNVFALDGHDDEVWQAALLAVSVLYPTIPVVGYERVSDLAFAARHGFEPIGPLRVWMVE